MTIIRHRQRAITSLTPGDAKWINPQKFQIPFEPIFTLPSTFYNLDAVNGTSADVFRAGLAPDYDLNSIDGNPWQLVFKIRLTSPGTGANQVIFQQAGTAKRFMYHNATGAFRWVDPTEITFTDAAVLPAFDTWYLVHIRNDLESPGDIKLQLYALPSEDLENGDLIGEQKIASAGGTQSATAPFLGAGSTGPPTLGLHADLSNVIWGINDVPGSVEDFYGGFQHHWPFNEGEGLLTNDIIEGVATGNTPGDAGGWGFN